MSKSILVIDTPESCLGCNLENGHYCGKGGRYIGEEEFETIPGWCPLHDLPEKKSPKKFCDVINGRKVWGFHMSGFNKGFNACIDEILEGGEAE